MLVRNENIFLMILFLIFILVSKIGAMTLGLARTFAPNFGKVEKKVNADGTVETVKLSGLKGIGHAGLVGKF
jgi:hypothetical protein